MEHHHAVASDGTALHAAVDGTGPAVVLLHGWPHTGFLWRRVAARLRPHHRVVAPDLRGTGGSDRPPSGYDLHTLADDVVAVLDALEVPDAAVVGIDVGAPVAVMTALRHPGRVRAVVAMEGVIGDLPGAEAFRPPWWFGFHAVPGLAETVVAGHEGDYLGWFLAAGAVVPVAPEARATFVSAYTGVDALRGGFEHYRARGTGAAQISDAGRLRVPALAVAGGVVGEVTGKQLASIADDLECVAIPGCGHLVPEERPDELAGHLERFLARVGAAAR